MRAETRIELTEARPTPLEVLIGSFRQLLETGRRAGRGDIAKRVGSTSRVVEGRLRALETRMTIRRNEAGEVTVAGGLSVEPTGHRMEFDGRLRFTCCAFDALGILGALETNGVIESTSPETSAPLRVTFQAGRPEASDAVLFYADDSCCTSVLDEWCPNVNFFEGKEQAARWAERSGVVGIVLGLGEATERATREWTPLVAPPGDSPEAPRL
jgi:hypothetical protein